MRPEVEPWWRQAEADLDAAHKNHEMQIYFAASWFAQQAAEKGLKALYTERKGVLAPQTHNLIYLGAELQMPAPIASDLAHLNPAFDLVRYPDSTSSQAPIDHITSQIAAGHLAAADRILTWIRGQL